MTRAVTLSLCILLFSLNSAASLAAAADRQDAWKFVVLGDNRSDPCKAGGGVNGINTQALASIAAAVAAEAPDVVIVPGDMILGNGYACSSPQPSPQLSPDPPEKQFSLWRQLMKPVYDTGAKVLPVRGNHEIDRDADMSDWSSCRKRVPTENTILSAYRNFFNDSYIPQNGPANQKGLTYALPHKNALFVGLDQFSDQFTVDQEWLEKTVAGNNGHLFVFGHYPAYVVKHKDSLACYEEARDRFWNALGNAGGRLYFTGHDHLYDRASIPDAKGRVIQQVLVGNGGAPFVFNTGGYPDPKVTREEHIEGAYGYVVVKVKGDEVSARLKVLDTQGAWRNADAFSYLKGRP